MNPEAARSDDKSSETDPSDEQDAATVLGEMYGGAVPDATSERTDEQLAASVEQALQSETAVKPGQVESRVEDGWATLKGELDSSAKKQQVGDAALKVEGIQGVDNQVQSTDK